MSLRAEWSSVVTLENGELFVMTSGMLMMHKWSADSWDILLMVSNLHTHCESDIILMMTFHRC